VVTTQQAYGTRLHAGNLGRFEMNRELKRDLRALVAIMLGKLLARSANELPVLFVRPGELTMPVSR
jgi:hypothetical protein